MTAQGACGELFATAAWQEAWAQATVERIVQERRFPFTGVDLQSVAVPLYLVEDSALWRGYEDDAGVHNVLPKRIAYLSSLYAISNPLNRAQPNSVGALLEEAITQARLWDTDALIVTNLEAPAVLSAIGLERPPDARVRLDATCRAPVPATFDEFVNTLGKSARSDLRRRHRRAVEAGVEFVVRHQRQAIPALPEFLQLTEQAAHQHRNAPLYDLQTFQAVLSVPGAVLLTAELDGRILAGSVSFLRSACLLVWAAGVDYDLLKTHSSYVFLLHETINLAVQHGCSWMDFGRGTFEFKRRHGFKSTTLHSLFYDLSGDPEPAWIPSAHAMDAAIQPLIGS